jgi:hypothetical protein
MSKRDAGGSGTQHWISLVDYASSHGVSLSTLRRHIKSGKIQFKVQDGRYLVLDQSGDSKVTGLEADLMKAHEEIAELKTLIALYEENITKSAQSRR